MSQIKCITFRSKYLFFACFFFVFFCEKEPSYRTLLCDANRLFKKMSLSFNCGTASLILKWRLLCCGLAASCNYCDLFLRFYRYIDLLTFVYIRRGCHKRSVWRDSFADFDLHTPSQSTFVFCSLHLLLFVFPFFTNTYIFFTFSNYLSSLWCLYLG